MAAQNSAPVIIKRKKVIAGGGHHGGAWKVAYADFVTAMMAFFMLMWLLNATTEKQRKGLADYFSPTIPIARVSGGGDGSFGGESVFSEETFSKDGTGATAKNPTESNQARGQTGTSSAEDAVKENREEQALEQIQDLLMGKGGDALVSAMLLKHIVTRVTDEGLIIELFDVEDAALFVEGTETPTPLMGALVDMLVKAFSLVRNDVAVNGFVRAYPMVLKDNPVWDLSAARAGQVRQMLEAMGFDAKRVSRVSGFADRKPSVANPMAIRNNRMELILLRSDV
ncbi:flagellar motor protein MotB [Pseudogemmobacter sp. W21_MBD1_M6]|uniref:flagellar motor protein MotB n=1 Tax=Pseudogemmobacter sp. W21_MBD1_M6 TaxID=3240271 RepID=UPI003F9A4FCA